MARLPRAVVLAVAGAVAVVALAIAGIAAAGGHPTLAPAAQSAQSGQAGQVGQPAAAAAGNQAARPANPRTDPPRHEGPATLGASDDEHPAPALPAVISTGRSRAGTVLIGERALTLYVFSADRNGFSACTGACARSWIPVRSRGDKPQAGTGLPAALVGSILRPDGSYQVTYLRRPLYYYAGDHRPGDANGNGRSAFGGTWQVATTGEK